MVQYLGLDGFRGGWVAAWIAPKEPVNVFISPPFADLTDKTGDLLNAIRVLQTKVAEDSVIVVQSERGSPLDDGTPGTGHRLDQERRDERRRRPT